VSVLANVYRHIIRIVMLSSLCLLGSEHGNILKLRNVYKYTSRYGVQIAGNLCLHDYCIESLKARKV